MRREQELTDLFLETTIWPNPAKRRGFLCLKVEHLPEVCDNGQKEMGMKNNVVDLGKQSYWKRKNARIEKQKSIIAKALAMHEQEAADFLYEHWPEHLPKAARGVIPAQVRAAWERRRNQAWMMKHFPEDIQSIFQAQLEDYLGHLAEEALDRHGERVQALIQAIGVGVRGESTLALSISVPAPHSSYPEVMKAMVEDGEIPEDMLLGLSFHAHYLREGSIPVFTNCQGQDISQHVQAWLALGMDLNGGLSITETLPLRSLSKDEHGNEMWIHQKRSYCVSLGWGDWTPASSREAAEAYGFDAETGEALPQESGQSFGSLSKPGWLSKIPPNTEHFDL